MISSMQATFAFSVTYIYEPNHEGVKCRPGGRQVPGPAGSSKNVKCPIPEIKREQMPGYCPGGGGGGMGTAGMDFFFC